MWCISDFALSSPIEHKEGIPENMSYLVDRHNYGIEVNNNSQSVEHQSRVNGRLSRTKSARILHYPWLVLRVKAFGSTDSLRIIVDFHVPACFDRPRREDAKEEGGSCLMLALCQSKTSMKSNTKHHNHTVRTMPLAHAVIPNLVSIGKIRKRACRIESYARTIPQQ